MKGEERREAETSPAGRRRRRYTLIVVLMESKEEEEEMKKNDLLDQLSHSRTQSIIGWSQRPHKIKRLMGLTRSVTRSPARRVRTFIRSRGVFLEITSRRSRRGVPRAFIRTVLRDSPLRD